MQVKCAYLDQQFAEVEEYFSDLRHLVAAGECTFGPYVEAFERDFASYIGVNHAIVTNTGTGALTLKFFGARLSNLFKPMNRTDMGRNSLSAHKASRGASSN